MPRFFSEFVDPAAPVITGGDAAHIRKSLRMQPGETLTLCDTRGTDYLCRIVALTEDRVELEVESTRRTVSEPDVQVTLFQCVPKGDKLETVVQKAVELGVARILPVLSARCVSRPDGKAAAKKQARYQKIADNAAGQSGRGILPQVGEMVSFSAMCRQLAGFDAVLFFYEKGGAPLTRLLETKPQTVAILIGPEGGWDTEEAQAILAAGGKAATLGKRILRTETAPLAALTAVMLLTGNLE